MDLFRNSNQLLKLFVEFLGGGQQRISLTPERWVQIEKDFGANVYADILYLLTQKEFTPDEARAHWLNIIAHQNDLNSTLGREVGFQVAMVDYFTNIRPLLGNIVFVDIKVLLQKERAVLLDELTGLYNYRYFERVLQKELDHAKRFGQSFSLLIIRVDQFREFLEAHGRGAAERALAEMADVLLQNSRTLDHAIRYGDFEFGIILPRCDREQAVAAARRYRRAVENHQFYGQAETRLSPGHLTVSVGLATYPSDARDGLQLVQRAGRALEKAKDSKFNQAASWA
ncbi:MAG: GGDEF domain-containing protein [Thermodesulfobacteriota bacterium]